MSNQGADTHKLQFTPNDKFRKLIPFLTQHKSHADEPGRRYKSRDEVDTICLHWTAGSSIKGALSRLRPETYGYHFFIDRDGLVTQGAEVDQGVAHAGASVGPQGLWVSAYSIGISFVMLGTGDDKEFDDTQVEACSRLILDLKVAMPQLKWITGHNYTSPARKVDPYTYPYEIMVARLNKTMDSKSLAGPKFQIWRTGDGLQGDPDKQDPKLVINGTKMSYDHKGKIGVQRYDKGRLPASQTAYQNLAELDPANADIDDFGMADNENFAPIDNKGLREISPATSETVKIAGFGQITSY